MSSPAAVGYWVMAPGHGALCPTALPAPLPDDLVLRALCTGVSPGTERLVGLGRVPATMDSVMAVPGMQGSFALPLLYGFTMWLTTAMNPPAPDPMQQRIFQLMPILFTFIMAGFPAGLLLYWTFSNVFSIFQQYINMRKFQVENPIDDFIAKVRGQPKAAA